jgi:urea transport system substrate-binding protein
MKRRYLVVLAVIIVALSAVWFFYHKQSPAGPSAPTAKVLRVGVLADKTGVMAAHGQSIEMGVMVAQKVLNDRGGILGRHVEVVSLDTQSDPAVSVERVRELLQAVIPVVTQARIPFIYSMDGECKTCVASHPDKVSDSVWGAGFTERMAVRPFMQYLVDHVLPKKSASSVFLLGGDYVYPRATNAYAKEVAQSLGLKIVGDEYVDLATKDYSTIIRRIEQSGADLLLVTHPGDAAVAFMRQAKQFELDKKVVISGFATFAQEAISSMGNAAEGVYYTNRYSDTLNNPENTLFLKEFRAMFPGQPSLPGPSVAAGGYGPLIVAAAAYQKAGSLDNAAFRNAMKGLQVALPQGAVVVDAQNNIFQQHMYLLKIHEQKYTVLADLGLLKHPGLEGCSVK